MTQQKDIPKDASLTTQKYTDLPGEDNRMVLSTDH